MNYISNNKLLYNTNSLYNKTPITADINLTNYCNQNCNYCRYDNCDSYMSFEKFKKVVNRCLSLGVKSFILTGGEPLINPDIEKIILFLDKKGISYGVNSNFMEYKNINPCWLKIGFDAWNKESYKKIRGIDGFDKVKNNIVRFCEEHPNVVVGIQQVVFNKENIIKFYSAVKDLPVDYISYRPFESKENYYNDLNNIKKEFNILSEKDDRILINYKWDFIDQNFKRCWSNWSIITINCNGDVWYCCHKPNEIVGNIEDENILEKKSNFITDMNDCEKPCRLTGNNNFCKLVSSKIQHSEFV